VSRLAKVIEQAAALNPELMRQVTRRLARRFVEQRASAKYRGVEFRLTFEEWRDWWLSTGHVDERGRHRGEWVMGRRGDSGAYEIGNLKCMRAEDNVTEQNHLRAGEYVL